MKTHAITKCRSRSLLQAQSMALPLLVAVLLGCVPGGIREAHAQKKGRYVLVKTEIDREKRSGTTQAADGEIQTTVQMTAGSFVFDSKVTYPRFPDRNYTTHKEWTFNAPPAQLAAGEAFTITASGRVSTTEKDGVAATGFSVGGDIAATDEQGNVDNRAYARSNNQPTVTRVFRMKAPEEPENVMRGVGKKFQISLEADGLVNEYLYEWRADGGPVAAGHLKAELDCGTLELVPGQRSEVCHILISGWCRNTANRVEVVFPLQSDGFGGQGRTGIVVPIGAGSEDPANMSGARGPDGSFGKQYSWTLFAQARSTAPVGTQAIPIVVRQQGCGEARLNLNVRVVPGRTQQSGPNRGGEGTITGGTSLTPPPVTQATSTTGLRARLGCSGTLVLVPGQVSQSCTIFIKGWRNNTLDRVEVFIPQESKPQGHLGNDLVAFPGSSGVEPVNMSLNADGEYAFGMGFRAMENAPGGTTPIDIIVRQKGHEDVRLRVLLTVFNANTGGSGTIVLINPGRGGGPFGGQTGTTGSSSGGTGAGGTGAGGTGAGGTGSTGGGNAGAGGTGTARGSSTPASDADRQQAQQLSERGDEFYAQEKWSQAEAVYRRALRLDPARDDTWMMLGSVCMEQKKWAEAVVAYRELVKLNPESGANHADLALALLRQGKREEALKAAREAKRLGEQEHPAYEELGLRAED